MHINKILKRAFITGFILWSQHAAAADPWNRLMKDQHHALFLGSVVSQNTDNIEYKVISLISGQGLPKHIAVINPKPPTFERQLKPNDLAIVSLDQIQKTYVVKFGTFKVDSTDLATLRVLDGPASTDDRLKLQKYINSGGKFTNFPFPTGDTIFSAKSDDKAKLPPPSANH